MSTLMALTAPLGPARAAHLLRRATWGANPGEIQAWAQYTPSQALDILLAGPPAEPSPPLDPLTMAPWLGPQAVAPQSSNETLKEILKGWWVENMRTSPLTLHERMVYFFHTQFTLQVSRVPSTTAIYHLLKLFRHFSLGNYKQLVRELAQDMALMVSLDNQHNQANSLNENFAREFLELFVVGKATPFQPNAPFTQQDVEALAKVFSGYLVDATFNTLDPASGHPRSVVATNSQGLAHLHDASPKTLSAAYQNHIISPHTVVDGMATAQAALDELDQLLDALFAQDYPALHLARKLYHFFVAPYSHQAIESNIVAPLAQAIKDHDYELAPVLRLLLQSQHFYGEAPAYPSQSTIGALVKSPLEMAVGTCRFLQAQFPTTALSNPQDFWHNTYGNGMLSSLHQMGLNLLDPFDVAGYPAYCQYPTYYRNWLAPNTVMARHNYPLDVIRSYANPYGYYADVMERLQYFQWVQNPEDPEEIMGLLALAFPQEITEERRSQFRTILMGAIAPSVWAQLWQEFASGNDTGTLRYKVQTFMVALCQATEYQLF